MGNPIFSFYFSDAFNTDWWCGDIANGAISAYYWLAEAVEETIIFDYPLFNHHVWDCSECGAFLWTRTYTT